MRQILFSFCLLLSCLTIISCSNKADEPISQQIKSGISIISFNIRTATSDDTGDRSWDNRKKGCLAMIDSLKPDLIGMQEVRPIQKSYFDANLKNYKSLGVARDGSGESTEYTPIYYRSDFFTLIASSTFWLSATPDFMSKGWDGANYRICTWAKFKVNSTGKELYYFNTHIDQAGTTAQKQGVLLIKSKISEIAKSDSIVFLTGDFNMTPTNTNIVDFKSFMNNVRDQFVGTRYYSTLTTNGWGSGGNIIDYIWYMKAIPLSYKVITDSYAGVVYISDHYPIMAEFTLK